MKIYYYLHFMDEKTEAGTVSKVIASKQQCLGLTPGKLDSKLELDCDARLSGREPAGACQPIPGVRRERAAFCFTVPVGILALPPWAFSRKHVDVRYF